MPSKDDVWDAVVAEWWSDGVPTRGALRRQINSIVRDLKQQAATGEKVRLWVLNCREAIRGNRWPEAGCTGQACAKHWIRFRPHYKQIIGHRYDEWRRGDGVPTAFRSAYPQEAYFAWLRYQVTTGRFKMGLAKAAREIGNGIWQSLVGGGADKRALKARLHNLDVALESQQGQGFLWKE